MLFKRQDADFMELVKKGKGFCLFHLADLLDAAPGYLNEKEQKQLRDIIFPQMFPVLSYLPFGSKKARTLLLPRALSPETYI